MTEFRRFPKVPRLHRGMIITEKIDGTNAAVIVSDPNLETWTIEPLATAPFDNEAGLVGLWAQSRKRLIQPNTTTNKHTDNFGFAQWVVENAADLANLGPGRHFGEWWGGGIQRKYGLDGDDKRFSLLHPFHYGERLASGLLPENVAAVPILRECTFSLVAATQALYELGVSGSKAAPGYDNPEGIVVFHEAARQRFKVTFEQDSVPKGLRE